MRILLKVNGSEHEVDVKPSSILADVLREKLSLIGVKKSCEHGECGSCTVLMNGEAVTSCVVLAVDAVGKEITTIEGLQRDGQLDPLQEAFVEHDAIQCGFCTPGMIITAKSLLQVNPFASREEIREALSGVLCRCTGYFNAIKAVGSLTKRD